MITPSFGLTATERVLPKLALDFTTASLDSRITFTRTTDATHPATYINSSGVIVAATNNQPRFDYDPVTLVCKGLLIEESRTNKFLNSLLDGTNLSTQVITVTAAPWTVSFTGTGTITFTGAYTGSLVGTGVSDVVSATFTPSAGTLTCTVSGTVKWAQAELGAFRTSFIPTSGAALTRNADVATMTGTNFSDWFNASEGSFFAEYDVYSITRNSGVVAASDGTINNRIIIRSTSSGTSASLGTVSASTVWNISVLGQSVNTPTSACVSYKSNNIDFSKDGVIGLNDSSAGIPTVSQFVIGADATPATAILNGHVRSILYWNLKITAAETQAFSK